MKAVSKDDNFYFLFYALLVLFFGCAVMQQFYPQGQKTILFLIIITLASSIVGINRERALYRSWYGLLLITASVSGVFSFLEGYNLSIVTLSALAAFLFSHIYSALKQVMKAKTVTPNHIIGSICIYLLLGFAWSTIYLLILEIFPSAFNGLEEKVWLTNLFNAMYFSFITLTTVGYGDISPALPIAQFFVFMESIIGSFYLAIMVASLVSIRLAQSQSQ
ncbi:potassium channel family protein [Vibrio splendidus]|uniref:Ion channel n=1 Tax=Vibrio splendidus 12E03 TaxID=1191305 RepID=A0A1E5FS77_VIBSP|nr:ion channel [Vibrio splendidus]OEF93191.1 ion channel [Vibrio splendidus 12E03]